MKKTFAEAAINRIAQLAGADVSVKDLYLSSRAVLTNYRLRLETVQSERRVDLVRVPGSFLFAHGAAVSAAVFSVLLFCFAWSSDPMGVAGTSAASAAVAGFFYWHARWCNGKLPDVKIQCCRTIVDQND